MKISNAVASVRRRAQQAGDLFTCSQHSVVTPDPFTESESGGSYGGGIEFNVLSGVLDGNLRLTADYMVYLDKSGNEFEAKRVGLKLHF